MIIFDVDSVQLKSVAETNPNVVNKLYTKYNAERILKEIPAETFGLVAKLGKKTVSECKSYTDKKMDEYLGS